MNGCAADGCKTAASRVIDGRQFCSDHRIVRNDPPLRLCALDGCGCPVNDSDVLYVGHWHRRHRLAPRLASALKIPTAAVLFLALFAALPAWAGGLVSATLGAISATVVSANTSVGFRFFVIDNESTANGIACTFTGPAALNTAGSFTIAPQTAAGNNRLVIAAPSNVAIREPLNCIAAGANTSVSVYVE